MSVYLDESATGGSRLIDGEVDATVSKKVLTAVRQNAHTLQWKLSRNGSDGAVALSRDELTNALEDVAQVLVDAFYAVQVQVRGEKRECCCNEEIRFVRLCGH